MMQRKPKVDFSDAFLVLGAYSMAAGVWQIYPPAALILAGAVIIAFGLALGRR